MNATAVPPDSYQWLPATDNRIGGFANGLVVSFGILLLITTITVASYCLTRSHDIFASSPRTIRRRQRQSNANGEERFQFDRGDDQNDAVVVEVLGLDEEVIKSFPKLPYEEARVDYSLQKDANATSCCSICLADYKKTDMIRVLPDCNHLFHDKCVDPWLHDSSYVSRMPYVSVAVSGDDTCRRRCYRSIDV